MLARASHGDKAIPHELAQKIRAERPRNFDEAKELFEVRRNNSAQLLRTIILGVRQASWKWLIR